MTCRHFFRVSAVRRLINNQEGISVPLVAVFATLGISLIFGLAIDISTINSASRTLSLETDAACKEAANQAYLQRKAAQAFSAHINAMVSKGIPTGTKLTRASLSIPTMPIGGDFCSYGSSGCTPSDPFLGEVGGHPFADLQGGAASPPLSCNLPCTATEAGAGKCEQDCRFFGTSVGNNGPLGGSYLPATFWNNLQHAGATALCETEARVSTIMLGKRPITAKSTWWLQVPGGSTYDSSDPYATANGLTLAIAPHMTTWADWAAHPDRTRFQFPPAFDDPLLYPEFVGFRAKYDPLYEFGDATADVNAFRHDYPATALAPASVSGAATDRSLGADLPLLPDPQRKELMVACMNPAVLVRNLFLQNILERSARHGVLRNSTEVLLTSTQNRVVDPDGDLLGRAINPNAPIKMVGFGDDLLERRYQLPYVFYNSGLPAGLPEEQVGSEFGPAQGGWINPFQTADSDLRALHTLIANQLRYCYHLNHPGTTGSGLGANARGIDRLLAADLNNDQFEAYQNPGDIYYPTTHLKPRPYTAGEPWEQLCPWSDDSDPSTSGVSNLATCNPVAGNATRPLNAIELVSSIGSIQRCPVEPLAGGLSFGAFDPACIKPADLANTANTPPTYKRETRDLRPDLLGTVLYLAHLDQANIPVIPPTFYGGSPPAPPTYFNGLISPGLFPLAADPTLDPWHPFAASPQVEKPALNTNTSVLIFTHEPLVRNSSEYLLIKDLVNSSDAASGILDGRRVTIVYMPVRDETCTEVKLFADSFKEAFGINVSAASPRYGMNALFVFSPYSQTYFDATQFSSAACNGDFDATYTNYWVRLLTPDAPDNIEAAARNIFAERIVHEDVKL